MKMNGKFTIPLMFFLLLIALPSFLYAQEDEPGPQQEEPPALTPEQNRINMDIRTSTLSELAAWARSLKLSEAGTSAELAKRIRDYYQITDQALPAADDKRKVIVIESARSTEYFKIETVDEEYARLSGEVRVSLKDGDAVHRISAWNILFNRTRNILTASGGVEYIKTEGDKIETFRGDSITVDIDNWSSVFLGGVSERSLQSDNTTYLFAGTVISRDEEEVTVLNRATISSANNPDSLWSLNASRVWLLPGSDFAILNAVLKVGEIPVMYIPFFYYAADEVIFHPVIGSRTREGNFIQTTTYILGRPKAVSSSQSSLTKILGNSNDMEKKREGMFLRSTGKKATDPDKISLKAMLDHYINLGTYIGADLALPAYKILGATNISLGIGLTRTIALQNGSYTPFYPDYDGGIDWNHSNFFSFDVPFRYRFKGSSSISGKYGSFTWSLPYYSDPLVDSDFLKRSEEMDWINMIQQGAASMGAQDTSESYLSHEPWSFTGQLNPKFPDMAPYINSISIGSISSTIAFKTKDINDARPQGQKLSTSDIMYYSPSRYFFAPDTATLYQVSATVSGMPLILGGTASGSSAGTSAGTDTIEIEDPLQGIGIPRSPFEKKAEKEAFKRDMSDKLVPPALTQRFDLPRYGSNSFSIDYRLAPQSASTLRFDSNKWKEYADIDWGDISNIMFNFGGDIGTNFTVSHTEGLYSGTFSFTGRGTWRQYSYLNEEAEEYSKGGSPDLEKIALAKLQEARTSSFSTSYGVETKIRPFYRNAMFGLSSIAYNFMGIAVRSKFVEKDTSSIAIADLEAWAKNPEWEMDWGDWDKEKVSVHSIRTDLSALVMDKTQTFSMTAELPPRDARIRWDTALRVWITDTSASWGIQRPDGQKEWKLDPFTFRESFSFGAYGNLSFNMTMDTEGWDLPETGKMEQRMNSITTSLNLTKWGVSAAFSASRMLGYEYIPAIPANPNDPPDGDWKQRTGDENLILRAKDFSLSYSKNISMKELWNKKLDFSINVNSRLFIDLQQYTSSNFTFSLGFTLGISNFLSLSISANSENARIYQYFSNWPLFRDAPIDLPSGTQTNMFLDLLDSFSFGNEEKRKKSGFKMKSFKISATHHLGDWNAILNWTMMPYRPTGSRQFEM
ncbi:MAG: LPS-assembly protein LptD, partial [Treponema sp.]|nr:LPS-assembly protein LptD [Treponema sp.]